jgi:hypothetical protein
MPARVCLLAADEAPEDFLLLDLVFLRFPEIAISAAVATVITYGKV